MSSSSAENLCEEITAIDAITWKTIIADQLNLSYGILFTNHLANRLFNALESSIEYYDPDMCKVRVFGKYHIIPRQQVAHSDANIIYKFSGSAIPGKPWTPILESIKDLIERLTGVRYNFVLINRYRNGNDNIGEHRDAEPELDPDAPIASLTLGQERDFVLRHVDIVKKREKEKPNCDGNGKGKVKIPLEHGSLLLMNPPTNNCWYHSLPVRKQSNGVRINLTFRKFLLR